MKLNLAQKPRVAIGLYSNKVGITQYNRVTGRVRV